MAQIHDADLVNGKLTNVRNLTPHVAYALSPEVMENGDICYSAWQGFVPSSFGHTPTNQWWPECMKGNGTGHHTILNAHGSMNFNMVGQLTTVDPKRQSVQDTAFRSLRPIVSMPGNKYTAQNYYRNNHIGGSGNAFECDYRGDTVEGHWTSRQVGGRATYQSDKPGTGQFVPSCTWLFPFAMDADNPVRYDIQGRPMGKANHVAPGFDGEYLYTFCRGTCASYTMPADTFRNKLAGEPTAKMEIRRAKQQVITDPFSDKQSECIAGCEDKWNARDARYITTYDSLFGTAMPDAPPPNVSGTKTRIHVVDATKGELNPLIGPKNYEINTSIDVTKNAEICIQYAEHWPVKPTRAGFYKQSAPICFPVLADGSVAGEFDCGKPYQLFGKALDGSIVAMDHTLHPAVCGEVTTCAGCHFRHSIEEDEKHESTVLEDFGRTIAGKNL